MKKVLLLTYQSFALNKSVKKKEKIITLTIAIPEEHNNSENIPKKPDSSQPFIPAEYNMCPKLDISVVAPAPHFVTISSYIPKNESKAPITVTPLVICPGVNFVLSSTTWQIKQTAPANRNA